YQIYEAIKQVASKHNIIYDFSVNSDNKFVLNEHISNMKIKEYMCLNFVSSSDTENVVAINSVIDKSGQEFQCFLYPDYSGNFFNGSRYFIERYSNELFIIYPVMSLTLLSDLYERLNNLEASEVESIRVLHKGSYIHHSFEPYGICIIDHPNVDLNNSRILMTCSRSNGTNSILETEFSYIMIDRD